MTHQNTSDRHMPRLSIDPAVITSRLQTLASAQLCPRCEQNVIPVARDTARLLIEVFRLRQALRSARLESANRLAAMHAALSAERDGENDPLAYLRWELPGNISGETRGTGRGWCR